VRFLFTNFTRI